MFLYIYIYIYSPSRKVWTRQVGSMVYNLMVVMDHADLESPEVNSCGYLGHGNECNVIECSCCHPYYI